MTAPAPGHTSHLAFDVVEVTDPLLAWLLSADGRRAAGTVAVRRGLTAALVDDLVSDACVRAWSFVQRGGEAREPGALGRRMLDLAALDLLRGRPPAAAPLLGDGAAGPEPPALDEATAGVDAGLDADAVRAALEVALRVAPLDACAALVLLAVLFDGAPPSPRCPVPGPGTKGDEAAEWAALWYAGRDDCLPPATGEEGAAGRKRRSRAVRRARSVLADAAEQAKVREGVGG